MQDLTAWLNSKRDFNEGVQVYLRYGDNKQFVQLLLDGETEYTRKNLFENLKKIYYDLKNGTTPTDPVVKKQKAEVLAPALPHADQTPVLETAPAPITPKSDFYNSCKRDADKLYKELMNLRAQLFALCDVEDLKKDDNPDLVEQRKTIALQLMDLQYETDQAYAKLQYVEEHGVLPTITEAKEEEIPTNPILLLTFKKNLISGINKLKKKEQTPERVALLSHKLNQLATVNEQISKLIEA